MKESPEDGAEYILNSGFTCDSFKFQVELTLFYTNDYLFSVWSPHCYYYYNSLLKKGI